jgi:ribosomal protein S18 acetylase RimI-like enzyme
MTIHEPTITIRAAVLDDAPAIAALAQGLLAHEQAYNAGSAEFTPWVSEIIDVQKQILRLDICFFVAEKWGEIAGYIKVQSFGAPPPRRETGALERMMAFTERAARAALDFATRSPRPAEEETSGGYIAGLFVRLESRRSNIGRLLVRAAEDWLTEQGIETSELHVLCANEEAISFWKDVGYQPLSLGMRKKLE